MPKKIVKPATHTRRTTPDKSAGNAAAVRKAPLRHPKPPRKPEAPAKPEASSKPEPAKPGGMRHLLEREQLVRRPLAETFAFFADPANLSRITPRSMAFQIKTPLPIEIAAGIEIDYDLKVLGITFGWKSLIEVWEPGVRFVDVQLEGPYKYWRHEHRFRAVASGTLIFDRVEFELPFGPLGLSGLPLVRYQLDAIFNFRTKAIAEILEG